MAQKWNLQDIRPSGTPKERFRNQPQQPVRKQQDMAPRKAAPQTPQPFVPDPDLATIDIIDGNAQKRKRVVVTALVALFILGAGFFVNVLMGGAEVTVYPRYKDVNVQANFIAHKEPKADELSYELLTLEAEGERQVKANGQEMVSERATGKIFIYNSQNSTQRLIKNTRFESPDGKIFRIEESVEVPAAAKNGAGETAPGVITAEVFADGTGEQYNLEPTRFTVPGLKGSDQYDKIYAESTSAFVGGFEGNKYIIDDVELGTAKQALHLELRDSLLAQLESKRPNGFILYNDAVTVTFDTLPATTYGDEMATIKERARLQVPIFKESEFAEYIAKATIPGYEGEPVVITDPKTLVFSYPSPTTTTSDIAPLTELEFKLNGTTQIVWTFDEEKLKKDLVGLPKTGHKALMSGYPALRSAKAVVRPFWATSYPDDVNKIKIIPVIGEDPTAESAKQ